jgi:tetratricopeptide (TPR) repeat protein
MTHRRRSINPHYIFPETILSTNYPLKKPKITFHILFISVLFLSSCFLNKKEKGVKTDLMQNITTKFNILYNSKKILHDAEQNRISLAKPNYQHPLPVFIEPNEASIPSNAKLMDSVIQKAVTIINDKSDSKYIDDAYFIMARANYEKGNYYTAAEFISYVINTVTPGKTVLLEASLAWKCRALLQIGYVKQAAKVLDSTFSVAAGNKHTSALAYATRAKYDIETGDLDHAIQSLNLAIDESKDAKEKLRWHYLLGQLLQKQKDYVGASAHFKRVIKSNASFEMAFNAQLNEVFMQKNEGDSSYVNTISKLKRMLKDDKNRGFTDQIHYIIGETYLQAEKKEEALKSFNSSLKEQSTNNFQRALTYLKMADLYFEQGAYEKSKLYYDSTSTLIDTNFPNYELIRSKVSHLDELVLHLNTISTQDTLQMLAKLPDEARVKKIDSIFEHRKLQEKSVAQTNVSANQTQNLNFNDVPLRDAANKGATSTSFYFNNPAAVSSGLSAFRRRWGNRSLEDNWRFKNKGTDASYANETELLEIKKDSMTNELAALAEKENFIQAIPLTEESLKESNRKIIYAYVKLGEIYRDNLQDKEAAAKVYTTLLARFPQLTEKDLINYNLYRLYSELGELEKSSRYKNQLLSSSPQSIYAKVIQDPDYLNKLNQESQTLNNLYGEVYTLYGEKQFDQVIALTDSINTLIDGDDRPAIAAQLAYLKALAIGRTSPLDTFEQELKQIKSDYPNNELITPLIEQHLSYIDSNRLSLQERKVAIMDIEAGREQFVDEPILTKWPELAFNREMAAPTPTPRRNLAGNLSKNQPGIQVTPFNKKVNLQGSIQVAEYKPGEHVNSYRDLALLPDSAVYYFVINVQHPNVNLSPSRYGIGQFNRGQYPSKNLIHQLKKIDDELQLLYIGKFFTYDEANAYAEKMVTQLKNIMKIPSASYNTFLITEQFLQGLDDFDKVNDYFIKYQEQR